MSPRCGDGLRGMDNTGGYADVNGLHMYYEVQGEGSPLVLLHGGVQSIDLSFAALIPELVGRHRVIGVELQGHGRTADIDRVRSPAAMAGDVVALLDHLGIDRAHVLGFSLGAAVTWELAVSHPDRVQSVVPMCEPVRPDGMHEDLRDPSRYATSTRMPTAQDFADMQETYARLSPHPERFAEFLAGESKNAADLQGWSDAQLAGITAPVLVIIGDHDLTDALSSARPAACVEASVIVIVLGAARRGRRSYRSKVARRALSSCSISAAVASPTRSVRRLRTGRSIAVATAQPRSPIRTASSDSGSRSTMCTTRTVGSSVVLIEFEETINRSVDWPARLMTGS